MPVVWQCRIEETPGKLTRGVRLNMRPLMINAVPMVALFLANCTQLVAAEVADKETAAQQLSRTSSPSRDLSCPENKALYCIGYAHLDTQWRWDFVKTIDEYIRNTLDDNFQRIEEYPNYVFNFTGSVRYEMMKEYYPKRYERLKKYIADGRWFVSGSSVDEGDVNVPSPESVIRQILYGNLFFQREFDRQSVDFMLPDCFGFPASMPSIWAHCGLLGFSTQKLTWGSAVGIPFKVGIWNGPDGNGVIAALDPGGYAGAFQGRLDQSDTWINRITNNGNMYGLWADYHYYGVGDQGGAPREKDVDNYLTCRAAPDRKIDLLLTSSDQFYRDVTPELRGKLPRYSGDMLLTEHSAGTLTSQSYMKRWNRKGEQLADAAERAASTAWWLNVMQYPRAKLERAWVRLLANQMHDILPGTSIPRAYRYSWNDDLIAINQFAQVLTDAVGAVSGLLDTRVEGTPLVVFNALAKPRMDTVEATVACPNNAAIRVFDENGREVPSQMLERGEGTVTILFMASVPPIGFSVFDARQADTPFDDGRGPMATSRSLENERYTVKFNDAGDIEQIYDRKAKRNLLAQPAGLVFTHEKPRDYPAWNMDWADRSKPPTGRVDGTPQWRITEQGPVRASIAITRDCRNSRFTQTISLTRDDPGQVVEVSCEIDWQSTECALKACFPLAVANSVATYNWGLGTIARCNNEPTKFEVPSHEWFDLTDASGDYGVSVLEDCKFGSDKPSDNELRLTLLYTPGVRNSFLDQHSQDWGIHDMRYAIYGHTGDWRSAQSEWRGRRLNQPLRSFVVDKHNGQLGRSFSLVYSSNPQLDVRAVKLAERQESILVRVQELWGQQASQAEVLLPANTQAVVEVDGQERPLGEPISTGSRFRLDLPPFGIRSFLVLTAGAGELRPRSASEPLSLTYDTDVVSYDSKRHDGSMDPGGRTYPAELLPDEITDDGVRFRLGSCANGKKQAIACAGQTVDLGNIKGDRIHLLASATEDACAVFRVGHKEHTLTIQKWTGFIGQWYDRVWDKEFKDVDFECNGKVMAILPAFIKRAPIAWFATHRHDPHEGNQAYRFSYLFHYTLPRPDFDVSTITLPHDDRIRIFAISISEGNEVEPAAPLYDTFADSKPIAIRHDYAKKPKALFKGKETTADVHVHRAARFDQLTIDAPRDDDDVDASVSSGFVFRTWSPNKDYAVHPQSGAVEGTLPRLNDGLVAQHDDDTSRCVWYDNEGRFFLDLQQSRRVDHIDTYSWHRSNRAPQYFSVWGSNEDAMPDPGFSANSETSWQLIAVADTRAVGDGGIHATRVQGESGPIGPFHHLLWVCENVGEGTFFTEIDIDFAEEAP